MAPAPAGLSEGPLGQRVDQQGDLPGSSEDQRERGPPVRGPQAGRYTTASVWVHLASVESDSDSLVPGWPKL